MNETIKLWKKNIFFGIGVLALIVLIILWFAIRALFGDANIATLICGMWFILLAIFMRKWWKELKDNG